MGAPFRFRRECAPRATAAVSGLSVDDAADLLWGARRTWNRTRWTSGGASSYGTPTLAVADVLVRLGAGVELYAEDGRLEADTSMVPEHLAVLVHERVRAPVRRIQRTRERPETDTGEQEAEEAPETKGRAAGEPLADWLARYRAGFWCYVVEEEDDAHMIATWGPKVLAGGPLEEYESWRVRRALRVFPPGELPESKGEHG